MKECNESSWEQLACDALRGAGLTGQCLPSSKEEKVPSCSMVQVRTGHATEAGLSFLLTSDWGILDSLELI